VNLFTCLIQSSIFFFFLYAFLSERSEGPWLFWIVSSYKARGSYLLWWGQCSKILFIFGFRLSEFLLLQVEMAYDYFSINKLVVLRFLYERISIAFLQMYCTISRLLIFVRIGFCRGMSEPVRDFPWVFFWIFEMMTLKWNDRAQWSFWARNRECNNNETSGILYALYWRIGMRIFVGARWKRCIFPFLSRIRLWTFMRHEEFVTFVSIYGYTRGVFDFLGISILSMGFASIFRWDTFYKSGTTVKNVVTVLIYDRLCF